MSEKIYILKNDDHEKLFVHDNKINWCALVKHKCKLVFVDGSRTFPIGQLRGYLSFVFLLGLWFFDEPLWNVRKTVENSYAKMDGGTCKFCGHTNCDGHSLPTTRYAVVSSNIVPRFTSAFSTWTSCNDVSKRRPEIPFAVTCHEHTPRFRFIRTYIV